jgi:hypothetical protein
MMKIYKYELDVASTQQVRMPAGATIVDLQVQQGVPCIWAVCPTTPFDTNGIELSYEIRTFLTVGTGHEFIETNLTHIGTYQLNGVFVGHVFERN